MAFVAEHRQAPEHMGFSSFDLRTPELGAVVVATGLVVFGVGGISSERDGTLCPLRWQADSQPLDHQGSAIPAITENISTILTFIFHLFSFSLFLHFFPPKLTFCFCFLTLFSPLLVWQLYYLCF